MLVGQFSGGADGRLPIHSVTGWAGLRLISFTHLAGFSGGIMFCDRDLVRERDLGHLKTSNYESSRFAMV